MEDKSIKYLAENGRSPLHSAVLANDIKAVESLIKAGADVNVKDEGTGATVLHYCALFNYLEIADLVLKNGGRLDIADNYGNQPLWTCVFNVKGSGEKFPLVEMFMMNGGDKNHKNLAGRSPNDFANQVKNIPLIELLLKF